ncbi:MAG TPA: polysaccharide deacetylase family protein, partial [Solirubrobacteraceae bacterium]|nr:polysaccharide deacetylase family protein [Solirubrobacteraceae bacterium]
MSRAAVSVTFDNLGEASDLERGWWPEDEPLGHHHSVTEALPRVLDALDEAGLRATFFVEGLNTELYPDTLRELDAHGHEVACHGWQHERWARLDPSAERASLERSVAGMRGLGLRPCGFRPPGGELTAATPGLLRELGFAYCSPAAGVDAGGFPALPFRWELLDAYHYLPHFADRRGREAPLPPSALREAVLGALDAVARDGGCLVLLFHPFLCDSEERLAVVRDALARV